MQNMVFPLAAPTVPIAGSPFCFPVRRIWCVGRNYPDHAREMGHDPDREPPFFFAKPADAVVPGGGVLPFPTATEDLHHEVELVVAIGKNGANIDASEALDHILGYAVGLDMTRRDLQAEAKAEARPWTFAKGFDQSCPISEIRAVAEIGHLDHGALTLSIDGTIRQSGDIRDMIWPVPDAIAYLSRFVALAQGDLIMTGTPAGVGPVKRGETMTAQCEGVGQLGVLYR